MVETLPFPEYTKIVDKSTRVYSIPSVYLMREINN